MILYKLLFLSYVSLIYGVTCLVFASLPLYVSVWLLFLCPSQVWQSLYFLALRFTLLQSWGSLCSNPKVRSLCSNPEVHSAATLSLNILQPWAPALPYNLLHPWGSFQPWIPIARLTIMLQPCWAPPWQKPSPSWSLFPLKIAKVIKLPNRGLFTARGLPTLRRNGNMALFLWTLGLVA